MDVVVNSAELIPGFLPSVCVKTGLPADTTRRMRFYYRPSWIYLLLFLGFGILLIAIIGAAVGTTVTVDMPVSNTAVRQHRKRMWILVTTLLVAPVLLFCLAVMAHSGLLVLIAVMGFLVGTIAVLMARSWVVGKLAKDGRLTLKKVSPAWARQRAELVHNYWASVQQHQQYAAQQPAAQQYGAPQYGAPQYPGLHQAIPQAGTSGNYFPG